jgi:hypothetical protein
MLKQDFSLQTLCTKLEEELSTAETKLNNCKYIQDNLLQQNKLLESTNKSYIEIINHKDDQLKIFSYNLYFIYFILCLKIIHNIKTNYVQKQ